MKRSIEGILFVIYRTIAIIALVIMVVGIILNNTLIIYVGTGFLIFANLNSLIVAGVLLVREILINE